MWTTGPRPTYNIRQVGRAFSGFCFRPGWPRLTPESACRTLNPRREGDAVRAPAQGVYDEPRAAAAEGRSADRISSAARSRISAAGEGMTRTLIGRPAWRTAGLRRPSYAHPAESFRRRPARPLISEKRPVMKVRARVRVRLQILADETVRVFRDRWTECGPASAAVRFRRLPSKPGHGPVRSRRWRGPSWV